MMLSRYSVHQWDVYNDRGWDNRAEFAYFSELLFQLASLAIDFAHDLHMLVRKEIAWSVNPKLFDCNTFPYLVPRLSIASDGWLTAVNETLYFDRKRNLEKTSFEFLWILYFYIII